LPKATSSGGCGVHGSSFVGQLSNEPIEFLCQLRMLLPQVACIRPHLLERRIDEATTLFEQVGRSLRFLSLM
jgi:hypothetical protein